MIGWRFDPRPRGGGDHRAGKQVVQQPLFRSAPPGRGRRAVGPRLSPGERVSIRAPGEGATTRSLRVATGADGFDPRPRGGGDRPIPLDGASTVQFRSAPPGRGRPCTAHHKPLIRLFRSAPPGRGRRGGWCLNLERRMFRSAPPGRGRQACNAARAASASFRSAPPGRGRPLRRHLWRRIWPVSIRAPGEGATYAGARRRRASRVSIRAPGEGATTQGRAAGGLRVFRSAPPGRGRHMRPLGGLGIPMFRSAPPGRGRPSTPARSATSRTVSIRAPGEGATGPSSDMLAAMMCFDPRPRGGGDRLLARSSVRV